MQPPSSFFQPHHALVAHLQRGAPVFLPVNPVEYHGPHLPLTNDSVVSHGLIADLHRRLCESMGRDWPLIVIPELGVGANPVLGPGSRPTPVMLLRSVLEHACMSIVGLGARKAVLMTFHGDPIHNLALEHAARYLRARGVDAVAPMHLLLREAMDPAPGRFEPLLDRIRVPAERARTAAQLHTDLHAGLLETSLTLHYAPESVADSYHELPPCPTFPPVRSVGAAATAARRLGRLQLATELSFAARGMGWYKVRPLPGYTGSPHLATPEAGEALAEFIVDLYLPAVQHMIEGHGVPPRPVMEWLDRVPNRWAERRSTFFGASDVPHA